MAAELPVEERNHAACAKHAGKGSDADPDYMAGKGQRQSAGRQYAAHVYDVFGQTKFQAGPVGDCLYDAVAGAHDQAHIKSEGGSDPNQYDCEDQYQNARGKCLRGRNHRGIEVEKTGEEYAERQLQNIHDNCFLLVGRSSFSGKKMQGNLNEDKKAVQEEGGIAQLNPAEF